MSEPSALDFLQERHNLKWAAIDKARDAAKAKLQEVHAALLGAVSEWDPDLGVVVCGSLARGEWTSGSDIDWSVIVDGGVNSTHLEVAKAIETIFADRDFKKPNSQGAFGNLVFSHNLVHLIGGDADTNANTTQRVLLLLESISIGDDSVRDRVVRAILGRYLEEDTHFRPRTGRGSLNAPRFLINDVVRYWRTIAVDYASKHRAAAGKKFAIRNIKLRLSRKLIFVAGLLTAFDCHLDPLKVTRTDRQVSRFEDVEAESSLIPLFVDRLMENVNRTPLEVLARACQRMNTSSAVVDTLFGSYDFFLQQIDNPAIRQELERISYDEAKKSSAFNDLRDASHRFQSALIELFFCGDHSLRDLAQEYAVF